MALTIMDKNCTVVVDGHLGKARCWVHQGVEQGSNHAEAEEADNGVVLVHVAWLGLLRRSAPHRYAFDN